VPSPIKLSSPATREFWEIPVLFEDEHLLALEKPPLLLTSPDRAAPERPSLIKLLHQHIERGAPWATTRALSYLMIAHRLDFETSGVLLLAKSKPVLVALADLFGSERIILKYAALVQGVPPEEIVLTEAKLAPVEPPNNPRADAVEGIEPPASTATNPFQLRVDERRGKRSKTEFQIRERYDGYTLVECRPFTDRPHQVRAHLRHLRLPIAGDAAYGGSPLLLSQLKSEYRLKPQRTERPLISSPAIYSEELSLTHPITGSQIKITAPCPKDFAVALKYLRRYAGSSVPSVSSVP